MKNPFIVLREVRKGKVFVLISVSNHNEPDQSAA